MLQFLRKLLVITFFGTLISTHFLYSQNTSTFWDKVRVGGGFGLNFGSDFFSGTLTPSTLYEFNDYFAAGIGGNFSYISIQNDYKATVLGGNLIALFNPVYQAQLSAEFEQLHIQQKIQYNGTDRRNNYWYPALYLGAGFRNGRTTMGIRFDILHNTNKSIYANPWMPFFRVYF
ncbi:hypothetical protein [Imtechella halotolerans]|uniref:Alpha-ketoglutarate decarboxylase n=1 Tax=Imtechella halotolerans K1 TaxID=946077 RepID=I0WHX9_9FLAO|nr:hypothetical protein [Imtechella halotolerans]EID75995.1 hypothetical protein W5A_03594 [Imtechella halotolerans K1]WMQ63186.1 alpha-ketoglutarate decarboxylase [Imtechella halotolerans]